jgi:predicted nucleotidyltransferase
MRADYSRADQLPPKNKNALGLFITDQEWLILRNVLDLEPDISLAAVFGSRQSGLRRPKNPPEPLDIDIAIELFDPKNENNTLRFMRLAKRLATRASSLNLQVEQFESSEPKHTAERKSGVIILDRRG